MGSAQLREDIFSAVTFSNLITAKVVGLSWLTWAETILILVLYVLFSAIIDKLIIKGEQVEEVIKEKDK